jgi:phosphoglycolate phosphatase
MKKQIHLVMFDLDGTLADTGRDLANAVNYTRAYFNLGPLPESLVFAHVGRGVEYLLKHALPEENPVHFQQIVMVFLRHYEEHLLDNTALYPSVPAVLDYFHGKRRVVVSNKIHRLTLEVLRGLGVAQQFDAILGGDSAPEKKPHPALIHGVLDRFQIAAPRALMVGEGVADVEAGKRAGVVTCGVTYGLGNMDELKAANPDFLIDDLGELPRSFF